jgi:DNA-binding HxlR family transcriptional regulator
MAAKPRRKQDADDVSSSNSAPQLAISNHGAKLDRLIHERTRLAIVSALAANKSLSFNDFKSLLEVSDGNLSTHARKLEEAGYIRCKKGYKGRLPYTEYSLTAAGKKALKQYIDHMEALINSMKNS